MKTRFPDQHAAVWFLVLIHIPYLLAGCTGTNIKAHDPAFDKWRIAAKQSQGYSPSAQEPQTAEVQKHPVVSEETDKPEPEKKSLPTEKVTLKMHNAPVVAVLRALARAVNQNIIITENVKGLINIHIEKTPWDEAFLSIIRSQSLVFEWQGNILKVISAEDRVNALKNLEIEEKIITKKKEMERGESLRTAVVPVHFSDPNDLQTNLVTFLSEKSDGKPLGSVMVDKHTNALIIQAIPGDIEKLVALVEQLDKPIPQICIEAQIVETNSSIGRQLGIQWGGLYRGTNSGNNYWFTPGSVEGQNPAVGIKPGSGGIADPASGYAVNFPAALPNDAGFTLGYISEKIGESILAVQLSALQEDGKLNILSSPSITTLDNQQAIIESGKEVPFQTVEQENVQIEFKKAVLSLKVTPHVINPNTLKLNIITHKDELDFSNPVQGNPTIITKNAETSVVLFDGQTTVIGGLNKERTSGAEAGVPWLKNIPVLGYLFKSENDQKEMEEVLIFITPHILKERGQPAQPSEGS
jgi:type IV pilus secretin PilQ/predicted competence protein